MSRPSDLRPIGPFWIVYRSQICLSSNSTRFSFLGSSRKIGSVHPMSLVLQSVSVGLVGTSRSLWFTLGGSPSRFTEVRTRLTDYIPTPLGLWCLQVMCVLLQSFHVHL